MRPDRRRNATRAIAALRQEFGLPELAGRGGAAVAAVAARRALEAAAARGHRGDGRRRAAATVSPSADAAAAAAAARGGRRGGRRRCAPDRRAAVRARAWRRSIGQYPPAARATVKDFVDHIDYIVKLIGIDHVGISSDFDGGGGIDGWNSAGETFNVTLELVRRGYTEAQIAQDLERQPAARVGRSREGRERHSGQSFGQPRP